MFSRSMMKTQRVKFTIEVEADVTHENYPAQDLSKDQSILVARTAFINAIETGLKEYNHPFSDRITVNITSYHERKE
jgi:hypothetical protein